MAAAGRARTAKPGPSHRQRIPGGSRRHHLTAGLTHRPFTLRRAELVEARLEGPRLQIPSRRHFDKFNGSSGRTEHGDAALLETIPVSMAARTEFQDPGHARLSPGRPEERRVGKTVCRTLILW